MNYTLNTHYNNARNLIENKLSDKSNNTGLQAMGDGATIKKMSLFKFLVSIFSAAPVVLVVHDCSKHLAVSGKKDAEYVASFFISQMLKLDLKKNTCDLYIVDGALNAQSAGDVVAAYSPCVTAIHGSELGTSLLLVDISKLPLIKYIHCVCSFLIFLFTEN